MKRISGLLRLSVILCSVFTCAIPSIADRHVTTPKEQFGFNLGDDYQLANYKQLTAYWHKLEKESDRVKLQVIGKTEEGREMLVAVVSSPANIRQLDKYKSISRKLCLAEGISEVDARKLSQEGKAVVWIDGGLHANEVLGAQQLMETVYQLASGQDAETKRILDNVIVLAVLANPDGQDIVADWYMRESDPLKRTTATLPRLYQKYIGHDNNRDFFAVTQRETKAMNHLMYQEWFPQIVYNHHQTGPPGTVLFMPPFRDPFNYYFDPLVPSGIDVVGAAMQNRFLAEGKLGATSRSGSRYSTWWNGGLRTTCYFHNMIGLLTETIGSPTPMQVRFVASKQLPKADLISPVPPQLWHFRQSIDYSVTANKAVLDLAARQKDTFLFNIWRMGANSIQRGSEDHWTITPKVLIRAAAAPTSGAVTAIQKPEFRDPRAYIIPSDQLDFNTAVKFVRTLQECGIAVHRAKSDFQVQGKEYRAGSIIVQCAQAFRPHILDMFEPQDHPDDIPFPGALPTPPYDIAGWTLAYQMGVKFDRILEKLNGPFELLKDLAPLPNGGTGDLPRAATQGFVLSHVTNDSFIAVNRLLKSGVRVYWLTEKDGAIFIPWRDGISDVIAKVGKDLGLTFRQLVRDTSGPALELHAPKIALWDRYGGSIESGWTRWLLEKFEFGFKVVYPPDLDKGGLYEKFDALILPNGAVSSGRAQNADPADPDAGGAQSSADANLPAEFQGRRGTITLGRTIPMIKQFVEAGGYTLAIGSATNIGRQLGLPISDALVETRTDGRVVHLGSEKFFVPGSLLNVKVDQTTPVSLGMSDRADVMFSDSPSFAIKEGTPESVLRRIAWYDSSTPLRSGWAWGQKYLENTTAIAEGSIGSGKVFLYGPEIAFRAQPHGTFKFLFNALMLSSATKVTLP
ncbi:MAG: M14 metallopeptidase family protein [Chthonomonadales bacterium]